MIPRASFVIPVKDGRAYLAPTIKSCLEQDSKRVEVIVVDDGSTDDTQNIIRWFEREDGRVRGVFLKENKGRSEARNAGIEAAKSDMILSLDADDLTSKTRVVDTLSFFKKNPGVDIVYGEFQAMDSKGVLLGGQKAVPFDFEAMKKDARMWFYIGHSTVAFRKKVFEKVRYSSGDWSKHAIDDWKMFVDAHKAGFRFAPINKIFMRYRLIPKQRDEEFIKKIKREFLDCA